MSVSTRALLSLQPATQICKQMLLQLILFQLVNEGQCVEAAMLRQLHPSMNRLRRAIFLQGATSETDKA